MSVAQLNDMITKTLSTIDTHELTIATGGSQNGYFEGLREGERLKWAREKAAQEKAAAEKGR
jgi:hypothetical protein